ncbi:MAG: response regulator [Verrucomicrobia bacterium]|nr:response regulator [Verrucomicrobiota bacterium]
MRNNETLQLRVAELERRLATVLTGSETDMVAQLQEVMATLGETRQHIEELQREQAVLLEKAHDAVVLRGLDDRVLRWSAGAERIYGWSAADIRGRPAGELLAADPVAYLTALQTTREAGSWSGELTKKTLQGRTITVDSRWTLIRDNRGEPYCILSMDADITQQKQLQAQFLRAQRMESIGTLAGGIAHDLNNILAPILMGAGLLRLKLTDPSSIDTLDTMEASARRGADLVRQVLSFGRGIEGQRAPVALGLLVRDMRKIALETFPKSITITTSAPDDTWSVQADMTQLHQVLLNLCVNARDAMPAGGRIELGLANVVLDENYAAMNPDSRPGPHVIVSVADTGTGIPPDIRNKIFEPFFTTKPQGAGTGLGLSTTAAIVKGHSGFINVYSEVGKGTQIKVYLPAQPALGTPAAAPEVVELPWGRGETVLVADDEDSIGLLTQSTLERYGYKTLHARNGAEAIALFAAANPPVDIVLTDMAMPIMDGPSTIIALRRINPRVRVIGASGLGSNSKFAHAVGAGLEHFLHKPFTADSLLQIVRRALDVPAPAGMAG